MNEDSVPINCAICPYTMSPTILLRLYFALFLIRNSTWFIRRCSFLMTSLHDYPYAANITHSMESHPSSELWAPTDKWLFNTSVRFLKSSSTIMDSFFRFLFMFPSRFLHPHTWHYHSVSQNANLQNHPLIFLSPTPDIQFVIITVSLLFFF